ncbi:MAG: tol-pal system protein YbgF [Chromatiales bacterium]|jgi:tol-pal system protein YbgF|nr:tol-pal system protein YbgF [Chromatiales bacterium]
MSVKHKTLIIVALAAAAFGLPPAFGAAPVMQSQPVYQQPQSQRLQQSQQSQPPQSGGATAVPLNRPSSSFPSQSQPQNQSQDSQTLMDMLERLDALQRDVQELRGMVEEQTHRGGSLEQRQRELYLDIDRRLRSLEESQGNQRSASSSAPMTSIESPSAAPSTSAGAGIGTGAGSSGSAERDAYNQALDLVKANRYDDAIAALRDFLVRYPGSEYSANAQYWLGEANYVARRFDTAVQEFEKVVTFYPDSAKASDAMLKLGFSLYELQQWTRASEILKRVVEKYPGSTARQLADGRLQRMKMEGRL